MPSDETLKAERMTRLSHLSEADAARTLANDYGLSEDSVRGRLSRASSLKTMRTLSVEPSVVSPSVVEQEAIIADSVQRWEKYTAVPNVSRKAAFLSDIHFPYARWDALTLVLEILQDFRPDVVSTGNDLMDNNGFGRWDDYRTVSEKLWSADIANARNVEGLWYKELGFIPMKVDVPGNHDNWYNQSLRLESYLTAEDSILTYMKWKRDHGILQFSRGIPGHAEPAVHLSDNLVWWHGQFVNKNPVLRGKKTIEQFMVEGTARTVVTGHTHRPAWVTGAMMGYHGVNFYNSPCLSRIDRIPYQKRDPREWALGMVLHEYRQGSRMERGHLLIFEEIGSKLTARFEGKEYRTAIDKAQPHG